jgi:serine/threonine-protein kinase RsbW
MTTDSQIELHIPSVIGFEKVAMECAASTAERMGFSADRIEDLKTAVAEACLNAIEHGNKLETGTRVGITLTAEEAGLQVSVRDVGKGPGEVPLPDLEQKMVGEEKTRGWGIFLIKSLMNEVSFEAPPEGGNVIKMLIYFEK